VRRMKARTPADPSCLKAAGVQKDRSKAGQNPQNLQLGRQKIETLNKVGARKGEPENGPVNHDTSTRVNVRWLRRLAACSADVPIEQPQQCGLCVRSHQREFPCPYL